MTNRGLPIQRVYDFIEKLDAEEWRKYQEIGKNPNREKLYRSVLVCVEDGSILYLVNSYVETYENSDGNWYLIFSEHNDTQVFHVDDVAWIKQFKPGEVKIKKNIWKPKLRIVKEK